MNNETKPNGAAPGASQASSEAKIEAVDLLRQIERHLARNIGISQAMLKKLNSIDGSINVFAGQRARELDTKQPDGQDTH